MTKIFIEKINEATLKVTSDDFGVEQELCDFFTFDVPGAKFMPTYKAKIWDGKARIFNIQKKTLPHGLLGYVEKYAADAEYEVVKTGMSQDDKPPTREEISAYVKTLNLHTGGKKISMRDYQEDMVYQAITKEKIITISPTSSGKSACIYVYIRWMLDRGKRIILAVPSTSLVTQMFSDFQDYASETNWNAEEHCHMLFGGKEKTFDKPVLITTWQSVHSMSKSKTKEVEDFYRSWDVYIGDEAHRFASNSLLQIATRLVNAKYRLGTTGTLQDAKVSKLSLEGGFGPAYRVISTKELMDSGQVVKLKIKCLLLNHSKEVKQLLKDADYQKELDYIVTNEKRNGFIVNLAKATKGNTLILFNFVEKQGKPLYELAKERCPGRPIFFISGSVGADIREDIRQTLKSHDDAILIASFGTLSTGTNIPSIENVIFASPSKSKIRNLQSIGRGLRLKDGKTSCNLFDIADNFTLKSKLNTTMKHFKERLETYAEEQFEYAIKQLDF